MRRVGIPALLFLGGLTADFTPLSVYLSLHVSDVLLFAAGLLALPSPLRSVPRAAARFLGCNMEFLVVAACGALFLVGTALSTVIAGAPRDGVETWLLFAMIFLLLVPLTAVAVARHRNGLLALALGLAGGACAGAIAYLVKAIHVGEGFFYGPRSLGIFGSDPFHLMVVALAIMLAHFVFLLRAARPTPGSYRGWSRWGSLVAVEAVSIGVLLAALAVSRYRAAWVAAIVVFLVVVFLITRSLRATTSAVAVATVTAGGAYVSGVIPDPLVNRIETSFTPAAPDVSGRGDATRQLLEAWLDRPWGIGLGKSSEYVAPELVETANPTLHNITGHALVEGGPLAALAITLLPIALVALWMKRRRVGPRRSWDEVWPIAAVAAVFVAAQFSSTLYQHAAWVAVAALIGIVARSRVAKGAAAPTSLHAA